MRGMAAGSIAIGLLAALFVPPPVFSADSDPTGVEGVTAFRGDFVEGARVLAFSHAGPAADARPVAVAEPSDSDGRYSLPLPPGRYYLAAVRSESPPWPPSYRPGDLFCYYLGNPILVKEGRMTRVGFNMVRIQEEGEPAPGERSGVAGKVLFEDKPLGRSYVYVYRDSSTNFRGMGIAALPSNADGEFRLKLSPGTYYLLARKRKAGGMYGPPQKDDYIGYYHGNPLEIRKGEFRHVTLDTTTRIDLLEEVWFTEGKSAGWFRGRVVDAQGEAVPGLYVFFYAAPERDGTPAFMAGPTDSDGFFRARSVPGRYRLVARGTVGGPPVAGEWYGTYRDKGGGEEVEASSEKEVRIVVGKYSGD